MGPNQEPQPGATPPEATGDASALAQTRSELSGIQGDPAVNDAGAVGFDEAAKQANFDQYREKQTDAQRPPTPPTPPQGPNQG